MILGKTFVAADGNTWKQAGYTNSRIPGMCGSVYRYIRMTDGARVRIQSSKLYECQISKEEFLVISQTPVGTNERATGGGAAKIENDRQIVGF